MPLLGVKSIAAADYDTLTGVSGYTRTRRVNGEKEISFTLFKTRENAHVFSDIDFLWVVRDFSGEEYVVTMVRDAAQGEGIVREFSCLHKFYHDMRNQNVRTVHNGSLTLTECMNIIFNGSGYNYNPLVTVGAKTFDGFGNDLRIELFDQALAAYGLEFELNGTFVNLRDKIGIDTDFQVRHGFNLNNIERETDAMDFSTYVKAYGKNGLETEYVNTELETAFGRRFEMKDIRDDGIVTQAALDSYAKKSVDESFKTSVTMKMIDLRKSGYNKIQPNEGDRVYLIDPRLDIKAQVRIVEIVELLDENGDVMDCDVTLSNFKNVYEQQRRMDKATKSLVDAIEGKRALPFNALAYIVQQATLDLQSAQTELKFENGIIAISKINPNHIVVFNSAGLGISIDAGVTFKTAMTASGIVADVITAGIMNANLVRIFGGDENTYIEIDGEVLDVYGTYSRSWFNEPETVESQITVGRGYVRLSKLNDPEGRRNLYLSNNGLSTYLNGANTDDGFGSGVVEFWSKMYDSDRRGLTMYSNLGSVAMRTSSRDIYLDSARDVNIWASAGVIRLQPRDDSRAGNNHFIFDVKMNEAANMTDGVIKYGSPLSNYATGLRFSKASGDPWVYVTNGNGDFGTGDLDARVLKARNHLLGSVMAPESNVYLMVDNEVRVTDKDGFNNGGGITYKPIRASDFITASSEVYKQNIQEWNVDAIAIVKKMKQFKWNPANGDNRTSYGDILEDAGTPAEIKVADGVNNTSKIALLTLAVKQLINKVDEHDSKIAKIRLTL